MALIAPGTNKVISPRGLSAQLLTNVVANVSSDFIDARGSKAASFMIIGLTAATVTPFGSNDNGVTFFSLGVSLAANGLIAIPIYADFLRLDVSAYVAGTINGFLSLNT